MQDTRHQQTTARTKSPAQYLAAMKIDFKEFFGELKDWTTLSKVHRAQLSALGCVDALTKTRGEETQINRANSDRSSINLERLHKV